MKEPGIRWCNSSVLNGKVIILKTLIALLISCHPQPTQEEIFGIKVSDLRGAYRSLSELREHRATVLIFLSPECPLSENYTLQVREYSENFRKDGIVFYNIFPGEFYSREEIAAFCDEFLPDNTTLLDPNYLLTRHVGATITPEAFLLNPDGSVLYSGAIDNWAITLGQKRRKATKSFLRNAILSYLDGKPIETASARAVGCFIE